MLCDECQPKYDAWLEPRKLWTETRLDYIGQDTKKTRAERVRKDADRWYSTVNRQLDLIIRICSERHQVYEPIQHPLFNL